MITAHLEKNEEEIVQKRRKKKPQKENNNLNEQEENEKHNKRKSKNTFCQIQLIAPPSSPAVRSVCAQKLKILT